MKNRIWRQIRRTGIAAAVAGAVLSAGFQPETVKSADLTDAGISIGQIGTWTDMENGKAELQIRVEGLRNWWEQRERLREEPEESSPDEDKRYTEEDHDMSQEESDTSGEISDVDQEISESLGGADIKQNNAEDPAEMDSPECMDLEQENEGEQKESEVGYEYMEELASGETVQQENEEQEETGTGAPEGETSAGEAVEGKIPNIAPEETAVPAENPVTLTLMTYISEYFQLDSGKASGISEFPGSITSRQIAVKNQKGETSELTKLEYRIDTDNIPEEPLLLSIPLTLREEYRYPAEPVSCGLVQDEPLKKDRSGAGTFLLMEENGESQILAEGISPSLDVEAAQADMNLSVTSETQQMKAGKTIRYRIDLVNTGKMDLTEIRLTSSFSCPKIIQHWENTEGCNAGNFYTEGNQAQIFTLKAGESRALYVLAPLEDEQEKPLEHKIEATAAVKGRTDEVITRTASVTSELQTLKADFTVKKTADREKAEPGETVTYQICIVNTGEKTLHSVIGTERFQTEGIQARFVEQEGVTLNSTKTKALISRIAPGEAVSLQAVVKIPEKSVNQKLLNQVTVTSQETGARTVKASAQITVKGTNVTEAPAEQQQELSQLEKSSEEQDNAAIRSGSQTRSASSHPKTGDQTKTEFFTLVLLAAGLTILGGVWLRRKYRCIHEKDH